MISQPEQIEMENYKEYEIDENFKDETKTNYVSDALEDDKTY